MPDEPLNFQHDGRPFTVCEHCGSPVLDDESRSLVLMFKTSKDRKEFADIAAEELGLVSYNVDD